MSLIFANYRTIFICQSQNYFVSAVGPVFTPSSRRQTGRKPTTYTKEEIPEGQEALDDVLKDLSKCRCDFPDVGKSLRECLVALAEANPNSSKAVVRRACPLFSTLNFSSVFLPFIICRNPEYPEGTCTNDWHSPFGSNSVACRWKR